MPLTCIDLFAGTGAFSYALRDHGVECVFANDVAKASQAVYEANHANGAFVLGDLHGIETSDIPKHDILCAGFPCQPFSVSGHQRGLEDKRSHAIWKVVDILRMHQPEMFVLENVKRLLTHNGGRTLSTILQRLQTTGYCMKHCVIDTRKVSAIPQHRERLYIVGFRNQGRCEAFDFATTPPKARRPVCSLLEHSAVPSKYYYTHKAKVFGLVTEHVEKHIDTNTLYQLRRHYVRENRSGCCPTLMATMGTGGNNVPLLRDDRGVRKLTPRECFNLQGFPPEFALPPLCDTHLYKLAGNAVSLPVVELLVRKMLSDII
jgi:DNA (cytosine-5)-methyltransferase 1